MVLGKLEVGRLSFRSEVKVEIESLENKDLIIRFNSEVIDDLRIKRHGIPAEKMGGEARQLLAASLATCLCSAFLSILDHVGVEYRRLHGDVTVHTGEDGTGHLRVDEIKIDLKVEIPKDKDVAEGFRRAERIIRRGCLMSRSLERGIKVSYEIEGIEVSS